ncbi:hypothetical protein AB0454_22950 [Streptomyces sp. NPDC093509]|uniref:hypothetical protein n=1 Tax=Streptomyces sp. NPDC093509 TaxID=3154982 RepID=UPI00344DA6F8
MTDESTARGVRIQAQPGSATISLDGVSLPAGKVTGYVLEHDVANALPMLVIHTRQPDDVAFEGLARIAVAVPDNPGDAIAEFLLGLDPAAVQRAALDRPDLEDGKAGVTAAILKQLAEWAQGRS